jgi:hypothetical protein
MSPAWQDKLNLPDLTYRDFECGADQLASSSSFRISNETNLGLPSLSANETETMR